MHSASDHGYSIEGQLPGPSKPELNPIRVYNLHIIHNDDPAKVYTVPFLDIRKAEEYAERHSAFHWPEGVRRPLLQWGPCSALDGLQVPTEAKLQTRIVGATQALRRAGVWHEIEFVIYEWWL